MPRNARPSCRRFDTLVIERSMFSSIQVLRSTESSSAVSWCSPASIAFSAMKRNGDASSSWAAPSASVGAFQTCSSADFARPFARACSMNLVTMTYQLPSDMTTSSPSTKRATKSPFAHSAPSPYGFSTVADVEGSGGGTGRSDPFDAAGAATIGAAPDAASTCAAVFSWASTDCGATSVPPAPAAIIRLAASAARKCFLIRTPYLFRIDPGSRRRLPRCLPRQFRLKENGTRTRTDCPWAIQLKRLTALSAARLSTGSPAARPAGS
ncbi:hypothetical protein CSX04_07540 [Burkholderia cepacia]|nr:hypothetical protein CSX04_07540 [Burkholderia cepacia]